MGRFLPIYESQRFQWQKNSEQLSVSSNVYKPCSAAMLKGLKVYKTGELHHQECQFVSSILQSWLVPGNLLSNLSTSKPHFISIASFYGFLQPNHELDRQENASKASTTPVFTRGELRIRPISLLIH